MLAGLHIVGMNREGDGVILAIAHHGERRDSGVDCQPAGSFSRSVPCAGPFTLLCTVHEKSKDCVPTGTAPAAGESVTEIAGPIISGCGTMPSVCTALHRLNHFGQVQRHALVRQLHAGRKRIGRERLIAIASIRQIVIGLLFVGPREIRARERGIGRRGDFDCRARLRVCREALGRIGGGTDLPCFAVGRFHRHRIQGHHFGALVEHVHLHAERLPGDRDREGRGDRAEGVARAGGRRRRRHRRPAAKCPATRPEPFRTGPAWRAVQRARRPCPPPADWRLPASPIRARVARSPSASSGAMAWGRSG